MAPFRPGDQRRHGLGKGDAAAFHHNIDIVIGRTQEAITDIAADHEGAHAHLAGGLRDDRKDGAVQVSLGNGLGHGCTGCIGGMPSDQQGGVSIRSNNAPLRRKNSDCRPLVIAI